MASSAWVRNHPRIRVIQVWKYLHMTITTMKMMTIFKRLIPPQVKDPKKIMLPSRTRLFLLLITPLRKKKDNKDTFIHDEESEKKGVKKARLSPLTIPAGARRFFYSLHPHYLRSRHPLSTKVMGFSSSCLAGPPRSREGPPHMTPIPENNCSTRNHEEKGYFGDLLTRTTMGNTDSITQY